MIGRIIRWLTTVWIVCATAVGLAQTPVAPQLIYIPIDQFTEVTASVFELSGYNGDVQDAILWEFKTRYDYDDWLSLPSNKLIAFGNALWLDVMWNAPRPAGWAEAVLELALRDHAPNLLETSRFEISPIMIFDVARANFDDDGKPDYLFTSSEEAEEYAAFLVKETKDSPTGFQVERVPLPVFFRSQDSSWYSVEYIPLKLSDADGDGKTEWTMFLREHYYFFGSMGFHVWGWENDTWIDETGGVFEYLISIFQEMPEYTLHENQGTLEFATSPTYRNNWNCTWTQEMSLKWRERQPQIQNDIVRDDSFGCALTDAENAMLSGDIEAAIHHYENALKRGMDTAQELERRTYAAARLAIAFALNGEVDKAHSILVDAPTEGVFGGMIASMRVAYQRDPGASSLCKAAHDFIESTNRAQSVETYGYPFTIGETITFEIWEARRPRPMANEAGCDLTRFAAPIPTPIIVPEPTLRTNVDSEHTRIVDLLTSTETELVSNALEPEEILRLRYYRGMALDALARNDEAAAEYAAVVELEPDSAWGQLAAMHLQP